MTFDPGKYKEEFLGLLNSVNETFGTDVETSGDEIMKFWIAFAAYDNVKRKERWKEQKKMGRANNV